jgi:membrane protein implicated in regulation of membrane protease activity
MQPWHWLVIGVVILLLELLGTQGFLLGIAAASFLVGLLGFFIPMSLGVQLSLFAVVAVILTYVYWRRFASFNKASDKPLLNERSHRLIGHRAKLLVAVEHGRGKLQVGDTLWTAIADIDIPENTLVEVIAAEGMNLRVKPIDS